MTELDPRIQEKLDAAKQKAAEKRVREEPLEPLGVDMPDENVIRDALLGMAIGVISVLAILVAYVSLYRGF